MSRGGGAAHNRTGREVGRLTATRLRGMTMVSMQLPTRNRPAADDSLAGFFLGRLSSLVARHAAATSPQERTALAHAVFSIYLDCRDLGLDEEAEVILNRELLELTERSA